MAEAAIRMMSAEQRMRIYGLAKELKMSTRSAEKDDELHQLVAGITGKDSLQTLTCDEAERILGELRHRRRMRETFVPSAKPSGVTPGQQQKMIALICELRKCDNPPSNATVEQRVAGIIQSKLHIDAVAAKPYQWLTYQQGNQLIEITKGILATAQRRVQAKE